MYNGINLTSFRRKQKLINVAFSSVNSNIHEFEFSFDVLSGPPRHIISYMYRLHLKVQTSVCHDFVKTGVA